jgi:integrase
MARVLNKLNDRMIRGVTTEGRHGDGGGLYLQVAPSGSRSWVYAWKAGAKRTVIGLGGYPAVSLAEARGIAAANRRMVAAGLNPLSERRKNEAVPIFKEAVAQFLDAQRLASWRNLKHRDQWTMTLGPAYCTAILDLPVNRIDTEAVLSVLKPLWTTKAETASRLRGRIERVLAFAEARGWRPEGKNPAQWKNGLDAILPPRQRLQRGHHKALAYHDIPAFMQRLTALPGVSAMALRFIILTAARSGEAVGARWSEIDLTKRIWTVPASRMKAKREHRVPLSDSAVDILNMMIAVEVGDFVFPGQLHNRPISAGSVEMLLRRMKAKEATTIHGFRSSFRDWAGDATHFPRDLAEQALAHRVGDSTEQAYRRSDALEKRRNLMQAWGSYCDGGARESNVVALHGSA